MLTAVKKIPVNFSEDVCPPMECTVCGGVFPQHKMSVGITDSDITYVFLCSLCVGRLYGQEDASTH